jgi:hypothetical protein
MRYHVTALTSSGSVQSVGDFNRQREQDIRLDGLSVDAVLQRRTFQKLHGNERQPVLLANIVNRADVGMIKCRCGLRFALETGKCLRVSGDFVRQELQRDESVQPGILSFVNDTHASPTKLFYER